MFKFIEEACGGKVLTDLLPQANTHNINENDKAKNMITDLNKKVTIRFKAYLPEGERIFEVSGQAAKALIILTNNVNTGCTVWNFATGFRLAAYIYTLRTKFGLEVRKETEAHAGGSHARYFLITSVEIIK
jgi:hypothetical protein